MELLSPETVPRSFARQIFPTNFLHLLLFKSNPSHQTCNDPGYLVSSSNTPMSSRVRGRAPIEQQLTLNPVLLLELAQIQNADGDVLFVLRPSLSLLRI